MPSTKKPSSPKKQPAREPAPRRAVAKKAVAGKAVAKPKAKKASAPRSSRRERPPASEQHRRAVAAVQQMFRLCPLDAARWIQGVSSKGREPCDILEARWIEQAPRGPAYVVPPPRVEEEVPSTPEALLGRLLKSTLEREAAESKGKIEIEPVDFDVGETMRQTLAEGGSEVELWMRVKVGKRPPFGTLLGVTLPDEHDDGAEMAWTVLRKTSWHLLAYEQLAGERMPSFQTVPLYLWPGTGLADPQENCSVRTGDLELPGLLGALLAARDEKERARERAEDRKSNRERLTRHHLLDQERREAAGRRLALTGDAGITEAQLAALVPAIDVENDHISMIQTYDIVRLWEEPLDALLASLPAGCLGLALFGWRPPDMSAVTALERCAFTLRRAVQGMPALDAHGAALSLAALGAAFVDPEEVTRLLARMRFL